MVKRVCVIGAGAAGLASLRYLTENPGFFDVKAFEQTGEVSGLWVYRDSLTDEQGRPVHSAMYADLVTNFPKALMEFPGFYYPEDPPCFIHHTEVRKYFEDFCDKLSLRKYIQFNTTVVEVKPIVDDGDGSKCWQVKVKPGNETDAELKTHIFDSVMICTGRYFCPCWPTLAGLDQFKGDVKHSHFFRHAEDYDGKTVAIMAGGLSGTDIAHILTSHAKQIYQCRNADRTKIWPELTADNVTNCAGITEVKANSVVLEDGKELQVDSILVCTGYQYSFPFLTPDCHPKIEDNRITPLYKHVVHAEHPTLGFLSVTSFPLLIDMQARFFVASLTGQAVLPSREEMERDAEEDYQKTLSQGIATRHYHIVLPPRSGPYTQEVAEVGKISPIAPFYDKMLTHLVGNMLTDFTTFRNVHYTRIDNENFTAVPDSEREANK